MGLLRTSLPAALRAGATGSGTKVSGGTLNVLSSGALDHSTIYSGGILNLSSGGTAQNLAVSSGGTVNVLGTIISNTVVQAAVLRMSRLVGS